jgi:hypothetical protein
MEPDCDCARTKVDKQQELVGRTDCRLPQSAAGLNPGEIRTDPWSEVGFQGHPHQLTTERGYHFGLSVLTHVVAQPVLSVSEIR